LNSLFKKLERSPGAHPVRRRNHDGHFLTGEQLQVVTNAVFYSQEESCSSAFGQQIVPSLSLWPNPVGLELYFPQGPQLVAEQLPHSEPAELVNLPPLE